ncbi:hypothetical protein DAI22_02g197066 [Oryza sativa Japonica Group]|nr:hypothetical protein DAI22_02g197066 [Oryza sativa Japonica Group]
MAKEGRGIEDVEPEQAYRPGEGNFRRVPVGRPVTRVLCDCVCLWWTMCVYGHTHHGHTMHPHHRNSFSLWPRTK